MRLESFRHHVLSLVLVSDQFAATAASLLQPRFFDNPAEQHLCRFILEYYREYQKAPKRMAIHDKAHEYFNASKNMKEVADEFNLLLDIVCDLEESAAEQSEYILDKVVSFCQEESLKDALLKSVDDIQSGKFDAVLPRIQKAMAVGAELDGKGVYVLKDADERKTVQQARLLVPSGQEWLDGPTKGGMAKRELLIVMAPPNVGKTTALINIGAGMVKKGKKVAHFTLEMSQDLTRAKYDQCLLGFTDTQLEALDPTGRNKIAKFMKNMAKNLGSDIYIKEFPAHRLTMEGLRAHLMLLKSRDGFVPDAILLDYLDLMAMPTHIKDEIKQLAWLGVEYRA
ncbi:MAG TPA: DnaB-like helicase C-terminal domain-containing protein, partial [Candidatus Paceibacterota bacterium]